MVKHIVQQAVNEETKASQGHNLRQETGDGDQSRKMTGYGGDFTRASTNKNDQSEEPRETSNDIKYELGNDMWKQLKRVSIPTVLWW